MRPPETERPACRLYQFPALDTAAKPVYLKAALHEGVGVTQLLSALSSHGLTMSNVAGQGIVIHRVGHDPNKPAPVPPSAS